MPYQNSVVNILAERERMCCSFYQNLPINKSHYTGYPDIVPTLLSNKMHVVPDLPAAAFCREGISEGPVGVHLLS